MYYENFLSALKGGLPVNVDLERTLACASAAVRCQTDNEIILQALDEASLATAADVRAHTVDFIDANNAHFSRADEKLLLFVIEKQALGDASIEAHPWIQQALNDILAQARRHQLT